MREPELLACIQNRIRRSNGTYSPRDQKAELLLRNEKFLSERAGLIGSNVLTSYPEGSPIKSTLVFGDNWANFNYRWEIDCFWDGRDMSLSKHIIIGPDIFYRDPASEIVWIMGRGPKPDTASQHSVLTALTIPDKGAFIYVKIHPWTHKGDLRKLEPTISKLSERVFGYSERKTRTFSRDLCWYDLRKKAEYGKLSYIEISTYWQQFHSRKGTLLPKNTLISAVTRIQFLIDRLAPRQSSCNP